MNQSPRILTWHVHGSYLYNLAQVPYEFYVPVSRPPKPGFVGLPTGGHPWPDNMHEIPAESIRCHEFDCILFQSKNNYLLDQYEWLTPEQRDLPKIYLEHDPPQEHPTNTRHVVDDPEILVVHVTSFNELMWDCGDCPTKTIEHGVAMPTNPTWTGETEAGFCAINHLNRRGRRLGADIFERFSQWMPIDLYGMEAPKGEIIYKDLHPIMARYRFFFSPIRYTSLQLAIAEAMTIGLPVIGLATSELASVIRNNECGYIDTNIHRVRDAAQTILRGRDLAQSWSEGAQKIAKERFHIDRFVNDWRETFSHVCKRQLATTSMQKEAS